MGNITNDFNYSGSRYGTFLKCSWQYYLHYYLSFGGWNFDKKDVRWKLWKLKRLYSLPAWKGTFIHQQIKMYILWFYAKGAVNEIKYLDVFKNTFEEWWAISELGAFADAKGVVLPQHHYKQNINKDKVYEECLVIIDRWLSDFSFRLKDIPKDNVLTIDVDDFSQFIIVDGIKIFTIVDFAYVVPNKKLICIIDWKIGYKIDAYQKQLLIYGCYYYYTYPEYNLKPENFSLSEYNVYHSRFSNYKIESNDDFEDMINEVKSNIAILKSFVKNGDTKANKPVDEELFLEGKTKDLDVCENCPFKSVCKHRL